MEQNNNPDTKGQKEAENKDNQPKRSRARLWMALGILGLILVCVALAVVDVYFVSEHSARIKFAAETGLSLLVLVVIIVQACIYYQQAQSMQNTLKEMRISRELENRAWVGLQGIELKSVPGEGIDLIGICLNAGTTPAVITIEYKGEMLKQSPPDDANLGPFERQGSRFAVFPNSPVRMRLATVPGIPLPDTKRKESWYLYGRLMYSDVFGHPHITRFCYRAIDVTTEAERKQGMLTGGFEVSETHNTFD